jgi:8-oxo-dGTP diphosphatase
VSLSSTMRYLSLESSKFQDFRSRVEVSTCYIKWKDKFLVVKRAHKEDQPQKWGIPGGKIKQNESPVDALQRELFEETQLKISTTELKFRARLYARIPGWDYILHLFTLTLNYAEEPTIKIDPKEHDAFRWVTTEEFKSLDVLLGQDEAVNYLHSLEAQ